jgi:hypothetical protein
MRSIRYVLRGLPHNLDDCIDFSQKSFPEYVSVELATNEKANERYVLKQLIGKYTWTFPNITVEYEELYGGCFQHESEKRQKVSIDRANRRLESHLKLIGEQGIVVKGADERFEYSIIYLREGK